MDFAKILAKIDSIESKTQLNESGEKPDFLDLDKDGDRKEPMKSAAKSAKSDKDHDKDDDKLDEAAAPGQEDWIKSNKEKFVKQYGKKKGMEVLYATAWKRSKKKDESAQLEECYGQAMSSESGMSDDRSGMNISSSMDTRTGSKTLTVSAEGEAAENLAQILKLSGLANGSVDSRVSVSSEELEEYANEPAPQVQGIETQLQQGNDLNRPKKMTPHGYRNGDNPLAMDVSEQATLDTIERSLMEELDAIKASPLDRSKIPAAKRKAAGGDWKTTTQDLERAKERNISGPEGLAALKKKTGVAEGYKLKITKVRKYAILGDPDDHIDDTNEKEVDYEIINLRTGEVVGTANIDTGDYFAGTKMIVTMKNGAKRMVDVRPGEGATSAFNRFVQNPKTSKKYQVEQHATEGVAEGFKNSYSVGDRVDSPLGTGTIVALSKNIDIDDKVSVKLDDPSKAGEDGKHKDTFVLTTSMLKHLPEQGVAEEKKNTKSGTVHKAKPGRYGGYDPETDPDKDEDDKKSEPAAKRGRGRPKKNADSDTGEVKKWDTSALQSAFGSSAPKNLPGKASVKHKMKDDDVSESTKRIFLNQKKKIM